MRYILEPDNVIPNRWAIYSDDGRKHELVAVFHGYAFAKEYFDLINRENSVDKTRDI